MANVDIVTGKLADVTLSKVDENKENGSPDQLWKKESEKQKLENELLRKKIQEIERERQEIKRERQELEERLDRQEEKARYTLTEKKQQRQPRVSTEDTVKSLGLSKAKEVVRNYRINTEKLATATGEEKAIIKKELEILEPNLMAANKKLGEPSAIAGDTYLRGSFMSRVVDMPSSLFCKAFHDDFDVSAELDDEEGILRKVTQILGVQVRSWEKEDDWTDVLAKLIGLVADAGFKVKTRNHHVMGGPADSGGVPDIAVLAYDEAAVLLEESKMSGGFALCQDTVYYVYEGERIFKEPVGNTTMREIFPCLLMTSHIEEVLIHGIVTLPSPLEKYHNQPRRVALKHLRSFLLLSPARVIPMLRYLKGMLNTLRDMWKATRLRRKDTTTYDQLLCTYVSDLPKVTSFRTKDSNEKVPLRLVQYVRGSVFKAQNNRNENLIVKFVEAPYGKDAHEFCAEKNYAPELLSIDRFESCWMVVMKEIQGQSLDEIDVCSLEESTKCTIARNLKDALTYLHTEYVHGDFRQPNVMVEEKTNKVFIIDFDWADEPSCAVYPSYLNGKINWPPGAKQGGEIVKEHDDYFLSKHLAWLGYSEMPE